MNVLVSKVRGIYVPELGKLTYNAKIPFFRHWSQRRIIIERTATTTILGGSKKSPV